jgi:hypothetical protein
MTALKATLTHSDATRLTRLAKHGKPVWPTMCGIELDRGEFWGKKADMAKLEVLGLVEFQMVAHGPAQIPHYTVSAAGHEYLAANAGTNEPGKS